jgi:predicted AAA+ superfamily ATPase
MTVENICSTLPLDSREHLFNPSPGGIVKVMRDDQIRQRLIEMNPWWRAAVARQDPTAWVATDQVLRSRLSYDLGYRSGLLGDIATGPIDNKLVILRGPRRVGKSVLLKDTIADLCRRKDIDPRQIIYLPTDAMTAADLNRALTIGRDLTRSTDPSLRVWLLDEVTSIPRWSETLKYQRDNMPFGDDTVVCTGSSWDDAADVERDLIAGRAGTTSTRRVRLLLPMSFRDVVSCTGRDVPLPERVQPWDLQGDVARAASEEAELYVDELDLAWQSYLTSGGFPRAVAEHQVDGFVGDAFVADLVAWLHRDVNPDEAPDSVALLLSELVTRSTSPLDRTNLAREMGYSSYQVVDVRLNRLVNSFGALWCHQVNDKGTPILRTQSKLYLVDPLIASLGGRTRAGLPTPDTTQLNENAIGIALARSIDNIEPGRWTSQDTIGYVRTASKNEIDFAPIAIPTAGGVEMTTPIEGKWVTSGWRKEALVMEGKFNRGVFATRNIVDVSYSSWALPAPLVALLLG